MNRFQVHTMEPLVSLSSRVMEAGIPWFRVPLSICLRQSHSFQKFSINSLMFRRNTFNFFVVCNKYFAFYGSILELDTSLSNTVDPCHEAKRL